jgi:hypothetical protein
LKTYRVILDNKPAFIADEYQTSLIHMELVFKIGGHAQILDPRRIVTQTLADLHLTNFMDVTSLEEVTGDADRA